MRRFATLCALAAVLVCVGCGPSEPDPQPHVDVSILPREVVSTVIERAIIVHGDAELVLDARGVGKVRAHVTDESGKSRELGTLKLSDQFRVERFDLPGDGDRALAIRVEMPVTVQWRTLGYDEAWEDDDFHGDFHDEVAASGEVGAPDGGSPEGGDVAPGDRAPNALTGSCEGRNVVVFLADSLAARHTTIHGYERETTPGLEQLAAAGVRFEEAHSQTSWTMPSVTSLFTAQTQERHGMLRMNQQLPEGIGTLAQTFKAAGYKTIGLIQNGIIWDHTRLDRGFDEYDVRREGNKVSEAIMQKARDLMLVDRGRPLFLYVHLTPPHQPYLPPKVYSNQFVDPEYAGEITGSIRDSALMNHYKPEPSDPDVQHMQALYDGHIKYVDDMIASTMNEVWKDSPPENWLVVVTSDHGEAFLQHGAQGHNSQVYQEMVHIPLVITAPGSPLPIGAEVSAPVSLLDIGPTLRALTGLPAHDQVEDGRSLLPLIEQPDRELRRAFFFSSRYPKAMAGQPTWTAVRLGDYKLLRAEGRVELYDLSRDPEEMHDLAAEMPIRARAMSEMLDEWRAAGVRSDASRAELSADAQAELQKLGYVDSEGNDIASPDADQ